MSAEPEARAIISYVTRGRVGWPDRWPLEAEHCCAALASCLDSREARGIKSESVGSYRVEYSLQGGAVGMDDELMAICRRYLTRPVNYLYRGVSAYDAAGA